MKSKSGQDMFTSGLIVGLFAGGIGQFLGTAEGRQVKNNLFSQWRQARAELLKKGLIDKSVPEEADQMLKYLWQETALGMSEMKSRLSTVAGEKKSAKRIKVRKKKTKYRSRKVGRPKFRGIKS